MTSVKFSIRDVDFIEWLSDKQTGISTLGIEQEILHYMKENTSIKIEGIILLRLHRNSEMTCWYDPVEKVTHYHQIIKD